MHLFRLRPQELELLSAPAAGQDDLAEFYVRFEKIKDFHRKNPGINSRQFVNELNDLVKNDGLQTMQVEDEEEAVVIDSGSGKTATKNFVLTNDSDGLDLLWRRGIRQTP